MTKMTAKNIKSVYGEDFHLLKCVNDRGEVLRDISDAEKYLVGRVRINGINKRPYSNNEVFEVEYLDY